MENMPSEHHSGTRARWRDGPAFRCGPKAWRRWRWPMAALFVALFSIFLVESEVRVADQIVVAAYAYAAAELLQFHIYLLDAVFRGGRIPRHRRGAFSFLVPGRPRGAGGFLGAPVPDGERRRAQRGDVGRLERAAGEAISVLEQLRIVAPASASRC